MRTPTGVVLATPSRFDFQIILQHLLSGMRRRWKLLATWLLVVGLAAVCVARTYTKYVWQAKATLLYTSLPTPEQQKDLYTPPDLKTLVAFVTSPRTFDLICKEQGLDVPGKAIERNLTVTAPPGTRLIQLSLNWDNGVQACAMLDRTMELFMEQVAELRRRKLDGHIVDYTKTLEDSRLRRQQAMDALQALYRREGLSELKQDQTRKAEELVALEGLLAQARRNRSNLLKQMEQLTNHIKNMKSSEEAEAKKQREFDATEETVADNRRRQDRLRELIDEERKTEETKVLLEARKRELARIAPLVAKGYKKRGESEALQAEIGLLLTRLRGSERINQWKKELEQIDKVVVPKGKSKSLGSPIIQQTLFRQLELQLQLTSADEEVSQLEKSLKTVQGQLNRLAQGRQESESKMREVEAADATTQRVEGQLAALNQLRKLGPTEFVVVTPAMAGAYPTSSNSKTLLLTVLVLGGLVGVVGLGLMETRHVAARPTGFSRALGLQVLGKIDPEAQPLSASMPVRALALKLRQFAPDPGSVILFGTTGPGEQAGAVLDALATCLARRDERVLVLDVRPVACTGNNPGLNDFLTYLSDTPEEVIQTTELIGVDHLGSGSTPLVADVLATHRMRELVCELKRRYSLILMRGPALDDIVDMTILSASAQAVVVMTDACPRSAADCRTALSSLISLGAPVIGQLVLSEE